MPWVASFKISILEHFTMFLEIAKQFGMTRSNHVARFIIRSPSREFRTQERGFNVNGNRNEDSSRERLTIEAAWQWVTNFSESNKRRKEFFFLQKRKDKKWDKNWKSEIENHCPFAIVRNWKITAHLQSRMNLKITTHIIDCQRRYTRHSLWRVAAGRIVFEIPFRAQPENQNRRWIDQRSRSVIPQIKMIRLWTNEWGAARSVIKRSTRLYPSIAVKKKKREFEARGIFYDVTGTYAQCGKQVAPVYMQPMMTGMRVALLPAGALTQYLILLLFFFSIKFCNTATFLWSQKNVMEFFDFFSFKENILFMNPSNGRMLDTFKFEELMIKKNYAGSYKFKMISKLNTFFGRF